MGWTLPIVTLPTVPVSLAAENADGGPPTVLLYGARYTHQVRSTYVLGTDAVADKKQMHASYVGRDVALMLLLRAKRPPERPGRLDNYGEDQSNLPHLRFRDLVGTQTALPPSRAMCRGIRHMSPQRPPRRAPMPRPVEHRAILLRNCLLSCFPAAA